MPAQFLIGVFVPDESLANRLHQLLTESGLVVNWSRVPNEFIEWVVANRHRIDCLVLLECGEVATALSQLQQRDILLPAVMLSTEGRWQGLSSEGLPGEDSETHHLYHSAMMVLPETDWPEIQPVIHSAVSQFLQLSNVQLYVDHNQEAQPEDNDLQERDKRSFLLSLQQQRLSEKLEERLGYVGIYYKRNRQNFLTNMTTSERQAFLDKMRQDYRQIILKYFSEDSAINQRIDDFVNVAFFADMSVPRIVEIHMELIEDFSKQLQLEGRNEDILVDYRLTLIDVIAHLCEMYRRALPGDQ